MDADPKKFQFVINGWMGLSFTDMLSKLDWSLMEKDGVHRLNITEVSER